MSFFSALETLLLFISTIVFWTMSIKFIKFFIIFIIGKLKEKSNILLK